MGGEFPCTPWVAPTGATPGGGPGKADSCVPHPGGPTAPPPLPGSGDGSGNPTPSPTPPTCGPLVSQNRPTTSSAIEAGNLGPQFAVDGNPGTPWSSPGSDPPWMQVDPRSVQATTPGRLKW